MSLVEYRSNAPVTPLPTQPTGNQWVELMQPAAELAAQIAGTEFVPEAYRRNPAAIAACILFGAEIGIGPMQSLAKIDIVKGRPAPRAELARAKALAAGHELWVSESTNTRVTVCGKRRGSNHQQEVTWTLDDVKRAGISNGNYQKYPRQMLLARASAELVRQMCPEVLGGIEVFAEEVGDVDDGPSVEPPSPKAATTKRKRNEAPASEPVAAAEPVVEELEHEPTHTDSPTPAQTRKAMALFHEVGVEERDERLEVTSAHVGRDVGSWNDLTKDEAAKVIDALESLAQMSRPVDNEPPLPDELDLT